MDFKKFKQELMNLKEELNYIKLEFTNNSILSIRMEFCPGNHPADLEDLMWNVSDDHLENIGEGISSSFLVPGVYALTDDGTNDDLIVWTLIAYIIGEDDYTDVFNLIQRNLLLGDEYINLHYTDGEDEDDEEEDVDPYDEFEVYEGDDCDDEPEDF